MAEIEAQVPVRYEPNKAVATRGTLQALLESQRLSFAAVIAKHLTPDKLLKMALIATNRNPQLLQCTQESFLKAVMTGAQLGLDFSGVLGRAYVIPYGNQAQFIIGYLGLIDLCRNSGDVRSVSADVVYKEDFFEHTKGLEETLKHIPHYEAERKDEDIVKAYMIARFMDGGHHVHVMSRTEIEKIRRFSKMGNSGPWKEWYPAMCIKTVIRHGCKLLPLSIETQEAIDHDQKIEFSSSRPEPAHATISLDDIHPGDPEDHTDVRDPLGAPQTQPLFSEKVTDPQPWATCKEAWEEFKVRVHFKKMSVEARQFITDAMLAKWAVDHTGLNKIPDQNAVEFGAWLNEVLYQDLEQHDLIPMVRG
ncbi:MAG: recombinase RecT [Actinomycetota bacterium]